MKKLFLYSIFCLVIFSLSPPSFAQNATQNLPQIFQPPNSLADLAENLLGSVVNISTSQNLQASPPSRTPRPQAPQAPEGSPFQDFFDEYFDNRPNTPNNRGNRQRSVQSLGSGFVIDATGIIITNNHVIASADEILVDFADGTQLEADVIGTDPKLDIAVLRVLPESPLTAVKFGDSDKIRVGDWALAIGNPFGQGSSVSLGIVSAINRDINAGPYDNFIQTDAAINRGNSGGPLFNMAGDVIGINTAIISPTGGSIGLGFSIPANLAIGVIDQLREFGETRRGWLGVSIQVVTDDIAESIELGDARGALVGDVTPSGPADKAGIKSGDIVLSFDGQLVEKMRDLPRIVAETAVDKVVDVVVWRKGAEETFKVAVGLLESGENRVESASDSEDGETSKILGLSLSSLTSENREQYGIEDGIEGLLVSDVDPVSEAYEKGIRQGDIIVELGQAALNEVSDAHDRLSELEKDGRTKILLHIRKVNGTVDFVTVTNEEFTR